jgi:hypothetical protein
VVLSPLLAFFVLRIRAMAPVQLPDPSMHTIYIVDPREMFVRYMAALTPTARLREGAQVGFLIPAHIAYVLFGAVPGFFVTRYAFALIVIVPAYLLLRRLYGVPAGVLAIAVIMSSPVVLTAWGTDYPDSAVVSYIAGAVACLAMASSGRRRLGWLTVAGVLMTLSIWSHGMGMVLSATTVAVYGAVRLARGREKVVRDFAVLGGVAILTTLALMVGSDLVFGQFDFIRPTFAAEAYLDTPGQVALFHSSNWRWALRVSYLLAPPAVIAAFLATFSRRLREIPTPQLLVGLTCAAQFGVFACLQFGYHVETLEMHYFSSTLWGVVCLALAVVLVELSRPLGGRRLGRWLPALAVVGVPLAYELDPHVPAFGWLPTGAVLACVPVVVSVIARLIGHDRGEHASPRLGRSVAAAAAVVAVAGSLLVLTVAPRPTLPHLKGTALAGDPPAAYDAALGGSATKLIDWYEISAVLPAFVGNPTYAGEQLLMWYSPAPGGVLTEPLGIFHANFNSLPSGPPVLTAADAAKLAIRRPAELLLLGVSSAAFGRALSYLGPYRPELVRRTVIRRGTAVLYAWLIVLKLFARRVA